MISKDAYLYHQVDPLKLLADWSAGFGALLPLWRHRLLVALLIMLVVPPIASFCVIRFADLEPYKRSALGQYVAIYMTRAMEAVRLAGMAVMVLGAWYHSGWVIALGFLIILFAWFRGKVFPIREAP